MNKIAVWILAVLSTLSLGCAQLGDIFTDSPGTQQAIAKIAVQYATLKAIKDDPVRAARVSAIADQALAAVGEDGVISAEQLRLALEKVIPWDDLDVADRLLASSLMTLIVQEVQARLPDAQQGLPIAEVRVVLGWVKEAAALVPAPAPTLDL